MAITSQAAGQPAFGRPVRNPLSLLRVDAAMARLAAVIGAAFFLILANGAIEPALRSFANNEFDGEGALRVPVWPHPSVPVRVHRL